MTPEQAKAVLACARAIDGRAVPSDLAAIRLESEMWARSLAGLDVGECMAAIAEHYAVTPSRVAPSDVRQLVGVQRRRARSRTRARMAADREAWLEGVGVSAADLAAGDPRAASAVSRALLESKRAEIER